ncbi:thioredoxin domain-containing protein [Temperatibacter marinus]|uniref:Thioredoxin domain-containing protein n=1 Tax=Temperatibacter marinus TaxID=1456591 RepID=A0AA52H9V5_9PROT|nr:thioredoxin domain-containing protein [Temperatibacter marinus]WND01988.1 thioredoxin domain-containing protein [Temperatibacter marinus]
MRKNILKLSAITFLALGLVACGDSGDGVTTGNYTSAEKSQLDKPEGAAGHFGDLVYGDASAPVEIIEYASKTCPHCATFEKTVFEEIKKKYIDTGKVRFIYRNFVMNGPDLKASVFMRCQDEDFAKKTKAILFERQRVWLASGDPDAGLATEARRLGLPRTRFDKCLSNKAMQQHLIDMTTQAQTVFEVDATPTLIVSGGKVTNPTLENMEKAIEAALK